MEANQSWSSAKSRWKPQAQNPAQLLLEALSSWTMGTEAHLEIQVGALFPEGFAWAEEGRLNLSQECKLYSWLFYMIAFEIVQQSHAFFVGKTRE